MKLIYFFMFCLIQISLAQDGGFWWKKKPATTAQVQNINNRQPKELTNADYDYLEEIFGDKKQKEEYSVRNEKKEEEDDSRIVFLSSDELNYQYLNPTNILDAENPPASNTHSRNTIERSKNINKLPDNEIKKTKATRDVGSQQFNMNNQRSEPALNNDESRFTLFSSRPVQIPIPLDRNTPYNIHYTQEQTFNSQSSRNLHENREQPTGNSLQYLHPLISAQPHSYSRIHGNKQFLRRNTQSDYEQSPQKVLPLPYSSNTFPSTPLRSFSVIDHKNITPRNFRPSNTLDYFRPFNKPPSATVKPLTQYSPYVIAENNYYAVENSKYNPLSDHYLDLTTSLKSKPFYQPADELSRESAYTEPTSHKLNFNPSSLKPLSQNPTYDLAKEFTAADYDYLDEIFGYKNKKYSVKNEEKEEEDDSRIVFIDSDELKDKYLNPTRTNIFNVEYPSEPNTQRRKPKNINKHPDTEMKKSKVNRDVGIEQFDMTRYKTELASNNREIHNDQSRIALFNPRPVQIPIPLDKNTKFNMHYTQEQLINGNPDESQEQSTVTDGRNPENFHESHHHYGHRHKQGRFHHPPGQRGSWNNGRRGFHRHNHTTSSYNHSDIQQNNTQNVSSMYLRNVTEDFIKQKVQEFAKDMNVLKIISNLAGFHLEGKISFKINQPTNNTRNETSVVLNIHESLTNAVTTEASLQSSSPAKNPPAIQTVFGVNGSASTSKDDDCVCVYYFLCNDGRVNTDGAGFIDLRFAVCPDYTHVCCKLQNIQGELDNGNTTKTNDRLPTQKIDSLPTQKNNLLPTTTARPSVIKPETNKNDDDISDDLISEIFSMDDTKFETTTTDSGGCVCVAYFLCDDGVINTDGTALIDLRFAQCADFEVCCKVPKNSTSDHKDSVRNKTEEAVPFAGKPVGFSNTNSHAITTTAKPRPVAAAAANSNDDCVCVDYFLCDDGVINTDGGGLIDLRFNICPEDHQVCCKKRRPS